MSAPRDMSKNQQHNDFGTWSPISLIRKIEEGYLTDRRPAGIVKKTSFAPSSIGYQSGRCARRWHYAFAGVHKFIDDTDAIGIATMDAGTKAHTRIQRAMEKSGILNEAEKEIFNIDPPIHGYVDCLVTVEGKPLVGEIKTTRDEAFLWRASKNMGADYHMYQILIYMRLLGMSDGFLLYENKSNNDLLVIPVKMNVKNATAVDEALEWMREVWENRASLPQRPFTRKSKECSSCPARDICWNDTSPVAVTIAPMKVEKL